MKLEFRNINYDGLGLGVFVLDKFFKPKISAYKLRVQTENRYGKAGGELVGDQAANTRNISINFNNTARNDTDYIDQINSTVRVFQRGLQPFYLVDTDNNRRARVLLSSINDTPNSKGLLMRVGDNNIDLVMLDSLWEDLNETEEFSNGLANGEELEITNNSDVDIYPIIEITALVDNGEFIIENLDTGTLARISTSGFTATTKIILNSVTGEIILDDGFSSAEISFALVDGSGMIKLTPGSNTLRYESTFGAVDLKVRYRERYIN